MGFPIRGHRTGRAMEVKGNRLKSRVYRLLEGPLSEGPAVKAVNGFIICLIALNVLAVILESMAPLARRYAEVFWYFEVFSVAVFTVEYALRLWTCTEDERRLYARPFAGRLRYALTPMALVDILAIAPFYLAVFFTLDLRFLRVFRLLRVLKLTRYSPAMGVLGAVVYNERRTLVAAFVVMVVMLVFASSLMHVIEGASQPDAFGSIPAAMWWGMATLTTVGYGDVTPVTPLGRVLGGVIAVLGIGAFALPAGILASGFAEEIKRRNFIISWNVVASVPLFTRLTATQIADIAKLLRPRVAVPGEEIVRKGDLGDAVYFITGGRAVVALDPVPFELGRGDLFGEIALLHEGKRTATVTALTSCRLLVLESADFTDLLEQDEDIRDAVNRVAEERLEQLGVSRPPSSPAADGTAGK